MVATAVISAIIGIVSTLSEIYNSAERNKALVRLEKLRSEVSRDNNNLQAALNRANNIISDLGITVQQVAPSIYSKVRTEIEKQRRNASNIESRINENNRKLDSASTAYQEKATRYGVAGAIQNLTDKPSTKTSTKQGGNKIEASIRQTPA